MKSSPPQAQYAFFFPSSLCWLCESLHFLMGGLCQLKLFFLKFLLQYVNELSLGSV